MVKSLVALVVVCALGLAALAFRPALDLDVARFFYVGADHFVGNTAVGVVVRYLAWSFPFALFAAMLIAAIAARRGVVASRWAPNGSGLLFCFVTLVLGPGLLVHATLKELSHRPRPYGVTEFGGPDRFRPFYAFDGACAHNCSFPSGETAAAAWTLAPASLAPPTLRAAAFAAALVFATATGGLRMAFGAHFLSDVLGAALMTILVIIGCRTLLVRIRPRSP